MSEPFIGEITMFAGNFAPRGWAFCNGQLLPIAQNTALFSLLGTIYGGNGQTTFALPDLQGRAPMHPGQGPGLSSYQLGQKIGAENVQLVAQTIPQHQHTMSATGDDNQSASPIGAVPGRDESPVYRADPDTTFAVDVLASTGGSQPHNNMQPFTVVNFIIALTGLYPSRN